MPTSIKSGVVISFSMDLKKIVFWKRDSRDRTHEQAGPWEPLRAELDLCVVYSGDSTIRPKADIQQGGYRLDFRPPMSMPGLQALLTLPEETREKGPTLRPVPPPLLPSPHLTHCYIKTHS